MAVALEQGTEQEPPRRGDPPALLADDVEHALRRSWRRPSRRQPDPGACSRPHSIGRTPRGRCWQPDVPGAGVRGCRARCARSDQVRAASGPPARRTLPGRPERAMRVRVATVALPMCGNRVMRGASSRRGLSAGSPSKTSSPAPWIVPASQGIDQRVLVDDRAPRRIDRGRRSAS